MSVDTSDMKSKHNIFLAGFSGSGKSTVGPILAHRLGVGFYDTDLILQKTHGEPIEMLFKRGEERVFREYEAGLIQRLAGRLRAGYVMALGGGAFENAATRRLVAASGLSVYLSCSAREIYRRLQGLTDRPLLEVAPRARETARQARQRAIRTLLDKRRANYRLADVAVSTTGRSAEEAAIEILARIRGGICPK